MLNGLLFLQLKLYGDAVLLTSEFERKSIGDGSKVRFVPQGRKGGAEEQPRWPELGENIGYETTDLCFGKALRDARALRVLISCSL